VAEIVRLCDGLPLAVALTAARARMQPQRPLVELADDLSRRLLDTMSTDDDTATALRPVFSWSYRALPAPVARLLRLLGAQPGGEPTVAAAAALCGSDLEQTDRMLRHLRDASLVRLDGDRISLHSLLRTFGGEQAELPEHRVDTDQAIRAMLDHYVHAAAAAMDMMIPSEHARRPRPAGAGHRVPAFVDAAAARGWLDAERATLMALAAHADGHGLTRPVLDLSGILFRYLDHGGFLGEAAALHTLALEAARRDGHLAAEAAALDRQGALAIRHGDFSLARSLLERARELSVEVDDRQRLALVLGGLGRVDWRLGDYDSALGHHVEVLRLVRELGDEVGEARNLVNCGAILDDMERLDEAAACHEAAADIARRCGLHDCEARALGSLGSVHHRQGRHMPAAALHHEALAIFRELGDQVGTATALTNLGVIHRETGNLPGAVDFHQEALRIFQEMGHSNAVEVHNDLGYALLECGRVTQAVSHHTTARDSAAKAGNRREVARAEIGLGGAALKSGDLATAGRHAETARAGYAMLNVPEPPALTRLFAQLGG
jgi:tetratricopeptide (TPR) repeat protein